MNPAALSTKSDENGHGKTQGSGEESKTSEEEKEEMTIRSEMQSALPDMFQSMGETALFTPTVGEAIPCHVFIDFGMDAEPDGFTAQIGQPATTIEALLSELNGTIPQKGDQFTIAEGDAAGTYKVQRILNNDRFTVKVAV